MLVRREALGSRIFEHRVHEFLTSAFLHVLCSLPHHFFSVLPLCVALLLCLCLRESSLFPLSYMCYRLLGSALPLLSLDQLQMVLKGKVMQQYGEHVVTTQVGLLKVLMVRAKDPVLSRSPLHPPF